MVVLFVDDSPEILEMYREYADDFDVSAVFCGSFPEFEAVDLTAIKVVVTDYDLGNGHTGEDVIKKIKKVSPNVYCILCSGSYEEKKCLAQGFFPKPTNYLELFELIVRELQ